MCAYRAAPSGPARSSVPQPRTLGLTCHTGTVLRPQAERQPPCRRMHRTLGVKCPMQFARHGGLDLACPMQTARHASTVRYSQAHQVHVEPVIGAAVVGVALDVALKFLVVATLGSPDRHVLQTPCGHAVSLGSFSRTHTHGRCRTASS